MRPLVLAGFFALSGCAAMHAVTGDEVFRPEPQPVVRGPVVPEPEPQDEVYRAELKEARGPAADSDELAPLPQPKAKKQTRVALKKQ